jgi:hypothetical protein
MLPVGSSLFADPELLRRFRARLAEQGAGPAPGLGAGGRLPPGRAGPRPGRARADPAAAALLLLGACEQLMFVELMTGPEVLPFRDRPDPRPRWSRPCWPACPDATARPSPTEPSP